MWPFKKKEPGIPAKDDQTIEQIMDSAKKLLEKQGGFMIVGINSDDKTGMSVGCLVENSSKSKILIATIKALQMDPGEAVLAMFMSQGVNSAVKSPIQVEDLGL